MISAIGISVLDNILVTDGFQISEGSFYCSKFIVSGGGMAATALCAASRLGSKARLFSLVGDDVHGSFLVDEYRRFGIDASGVIAVPHQNTVFSVVIVDSETGEKQFYSEKEKSVYNYPQPLDVSLLEGTEVLLVDGHWVEGALAGVKWAKSNGIPVV